MLWAAGKGWVKKGKEIKIEFSYYPIHIYSRFVGGLPPSSPAMQAQPRVRVQRKRKPLPATAISQGPQLAMLHAVHRAAKLTDRLALMSLVLALSLPMKPLAAEALVMVLRFRSCAVFVLSTWDGFEMTGQTSTCDRVASTEMRSLG